MKTKQVMDHHHPCGCSCFIVPEKVLRKLARDKSLPEQDRQELADTARFEKEWRKVRDARAELTVVAQAILPTSLDRGAAVAATPPSVKVYDCKNHNTTPGTAISNPGSSTDPTCKRTFNETTGVANFYQSVFGRNSINNAGMTLISSIHFSVKYNNAYWNGSQMTYGDGDGNIFVDFTKGNDVIGHELTHGVTQYTLGLAYKDQPGGLNESISDVFGSMFRQWEGKQDVTKADWLIGKDIMGPGAIAKGYTCLRDMANPAAKHCLAPQPTHFSKYKNGMDPHESSGIPNFAFYKAAMAIGGNSWETAGKIWYQALTGSGVMPNMTMKQFADKTRAAAGSLFASKPAVKTAVDQAWKAVGL